MGKFIVFAGACDGTGKSTQAKLLFDALSKDGNVVTHHFPSYNTDEGKLAENYLAGKYGTTYELSPYFINDIFAIDRAITWNTKLKELYEKGDTIIIDGYTTSSLMYQSALIESEEKKKEFIDFVVDFEYNKIGVGKPDIVIFLYLDFDLAMELKAKREKETNTTGDMHERDINYMRKVYDNGMKLAKYLNWTMIKCDENGQMRSVEDIHKDILNEIKKMD